MSFLPDLFPWCRDCLTPADHGDMASLPTTYTLLLQTPKTTSVFSSCCLVSHAGMGRLAGSEVTRALLALGKWVDASFLLQPAGLRVELLLTMHVLIPALLSQVNRWRLLWICSCFWYHIFALPEAMAFPNGQYPAATGTVVLNHWALGTMVTAWLQPCQLRCLLQGSKCHAHYSLMNHIRLFS